MLTHIDKKGRPKMVDVSSKKETARTAVAKASVLMKTETLELIKSGGTAKGDVLSVAQLAGISAAKYTPHLIPLCHTLILDEVDIKFDFKGKDILEIFATVKSTGKTGVEMEAMTAAAVSTLAVYDMCKAVDREMEIREVYLLEKSGGKSGKFIRSKR